MSKTLTAFCFACCLVVATPALADPSDLQASTSGLCGQTVIVSVHNPTASPLSAQVRVGVRLDDESTALLTSSSFTVAAGATASVSLSAPQPVSEISDDPEPIGSTP